MEFKIGTKIKGKELKDTGLKFYKVLREDMKHHDMQYVEGENIDILLFRPYGNCLSGGLYFTDETHILEYLAYGNHIREVTFDDDEDIYIDDEKFKAHTITLGPAMILKDIETWEYLIENNVNIYIDSNYVIRAVIENGYLDIVKYLVSKGIDITANNNYALRWAALNGHLDIVKYLVSKGANVTANNNCALRWATENEHLDIVKYLVSKGANVKVVDNLYIFDEKIYKYLKRKGTKITKCF